MTGTRVTRCPECSSLVFKTDDGYAPAGAAELHEYNERLVAIAITLQAGLEQIAGAESGVWGEIARGALRRARGEAE
jgi:hypothetical protein